VDAAEVGAALTALGSVVLLLADRRSVFVGGVALLGVAEAALARSLLDTLSLDRLESAPVVAAIVAAAVVGVGLALLFVRYPTAVPAVVLAAAPLRLPFDVDADSRFLITRAEAGGLGRLLPLYTVLGLAALALVIRLVRGADVRVLPRELALPVAAFVAFASVSLLWSADQEAAADRLAFYVVPFVVLVAVVANAPFTPRAQRALGIVAVGLAVVFASIGIAQAATRQLFFFAPSVEISNAYGGLFRVTSLFTDPSLYGRHVVLGLAVLLVAVWLRNVSFALALVLSVVLFTGLYFSYSQSSLAALFAVGVAVPLLVGTRLTRKVVAIGAAVVLVAVGVAAIYEVRDASLREATSGRSRRVDIAVRVFADHPVAGVGLAAQPRASQDRDENPAPESSYVSHTTPLTIAAELGAIGVALYTAMLVGVVLVVDRVRRVSPTLGLTIAAALIALFVHALFYSGFFEDPITWFAFGLAGAFAGERAFAPRPVAAMGKPESAAGTAR
jgi:hypothetical protein